jgi:hypothetical protein
LEEHRKKYGQPPKPDDDEEPSDDTDEHFTHLSSNDTGARYTWQPMQIRRPVGGLAVMRAPDDQMASLSTST